MKRIAGFTLIELLIVVAIIAILAAIAVPNFLEAQTRSKVSRLKADMRSAAVGVEAYAVDWNRPPIGDTESNKKQGATGVPSIYNDAIRHQWQWALLTTPVAYITFTPKDIFSQVSGRKQNGVLIGHEDTCRLETLTEYELHTTVPFGKTSSPAKYPMFVKMRGAGVSWYIYSLGPTASWGAGDIVDGISRYDANWPNGFYDPTNGTMSAGLIARSSRGQEP